MLKYFSDSDALPGRRGRSKARDPTRGEEGETRAQREFFKREARTALTRDTSAAPSVNRRAITTRESPLVKTLLEPPTFVRINKETRRRIVRKNTSFFLFSSRTFHFFRERGQGDTIAGTTIARRGCNLNLLIEMMETRLKEFDIVCLREIFMLTRGEGFRGFMDDGL